MEKSFNTVNSITRAAFKVFSGEYCKSSPLSLSLLCLLGTQYVATHTIDIWAGVYHRAQATHTHLETFIECS